MKSILFSLLLICSTVSFAQTDIDVDKEIAKKEDLPGIAKFAYKA